MTEAQKYAIKVLLHGGRMRQNGQSWWLLYDNNGSVVRKITTTGYYTLAKYLRWENKRKKLFLIINLTRCRGARRGSYIKEAYLEMKKYKNANHKSRRCETPAKKGRNVPCSLYSKTTTCYYRLANS